MFPIAYLYEIRNNFAIIFKGFDKNIADELKKIAVENIKISIFLQPAFADENVFCIEVWQKMEKQFAKYYEVTTNSKSNFCINELI